MCVCVRVLRKALDHQVLVLAPHLMCIVFLLGPSICGLSAVARVFNHFAHSDCIKLKEEEKNGFIPSKY